MRIRNIIWIFLLSVFTLESAFVAILLMQAKSGLFWMHFIMIAAAMVAIWSTIYNKPWSGKISNWVGFIGGFTMFFLTDVCIWSCIPSVYDILIYALGYSLWIQCWSGLLERNRRTNSRIAMAVVIGFFMAFYLIIMISDLLGNAF